MYGVFTPRVETVIAVGFRHDGDALLPNTNGYSYPSNIFLFDAHITQTGGRMVRLDPYLAYYYPPDKEYFNTWIVPATVTNLSRCELHLSNIADGKEVVTCQPQ